MLNAKNDFDLINCPLCGSDKIGTIYVIDSKDYCRVEIKCFSCDTLFRLTQESKKDVIDLWNGKRVGENC